MLMTTMAITAYGGPNVLQPREAPIPVPGPGEVTIDVAFAAVGLVDVFFQRGSFATVAPRAFPFVPGLDVSGTVRAVGAGVTHLRPGQPVAALMVLDGGYAEVARAHAALTVSLGDTTDRTILQQAATLVNPVTIFLALTKVARMLPGEQIMVHGAAGGLGTVAAQVAHILGAGRVIGTVGSPTKVGEARAAGYDEVVTTAALFAQPPTEHADIIIDPVGGATREQSLALLRPFGRLLVVGDASGTDTPLSGDALWLANQSVAGFNVGAMSASHPHEVGEAAQQVAQLVLEQRIRIPISRTFPLREAAQAHALLAARGTSGKLVLEVVNREGTPDARR